MKEATLKHDRERRKLNFVKMDVLGSLVMAMLDSGASHNIMKEDVARRLGLRFVPTMNILKVVDSEGSIVLGIMTTVFMKIGSWQGKVDFTIIRMDDYEVVLGIDQFMIE